MRLRRTGQHMAFLDLNMGSPFFAHGKFWTRIDTDVGCELTDGFGSACNFVIDGSEKSERDTERLSERVEKVVLEEDDAAFWKAEALRLGWMDEAV